MTSDVKKHDPRRTARIKLIHVARRELGLDENSYRTILATQGGKDSLSTMSMDGMNKVLDYLSGPGRLDT